MALLVRDSLRLEWEGADLCVVLVVLEMDLEERPYDTGHSFQTQAESNLREELPVFGESLDLRSVW